MEYRPGEAILQSSHCAMGIYSAYEAVTPTKEGTTIDSNWAGNILPGISISLFLDHLHRFHFVSLLQPDMKEVNARWQRLHINTGFMITH